MSGRTSGTRIRATRKPVVVLAGEDRTDRRTLRILLEQFCPDMQGRIVEINDAIRLRDAKDHTLSSRVKMLARKVHARAEREEAEVACVFVHEDLDRPDSDGYTNLRERVEAALRNEFNSAHYVLAAWEIEAWLLLFPDVLNGFVSTWKVPAKYRDRDTGRLSDPKRILMREVAPKGRCYSMSDAPDIFDKAIATDQIDRPVGANRSWDQFRTGAGECCEHHLGR